MVPAVIAIVVVLVVAYLYRRSIRKLERDGHQLRSMGSLRRHRREIRRDVHAWNATFMRGTPPARRTIEDDDPRPR